MQEDFLALLKPDLDLIGWLDCLDTPQPELRMADEVAFSKAGAHLIWPGGLPRLGLVLQRDARASFPGYPICFRPAVVVGILAIAAVVVVTAAHGAGDLLDGSVRFHGRYGMSALQLASAAICACLLTDTRFPVKHGI